MTTEEIRKQVMVTNWHIKSEGLHIVYQKWNNESLFFEYQDLKIPPEEALKELYAICSIDEKTDNWHWVHSHYILSQWDALNLVIRHEYKKSLEQDSNMLEMDKAIEALKNI
mgnify:FL=1